MKEHFNKYGYWYIGGGLLAAIFVWLFFIRKKDDKKVLLSEPANINTNVINESDFNWGNDDFPLKLGSMGDKVKTVQTWLVNIGGAKLKNGIDGKFGKETVDALLAFKQRDNISQDYWDKLGLAKM